MYFNFLLQKPLAFVFSSELGLFLFARTSGGAAHQFLLSSSQSHPLVLLKAILSIMSGVTI